MNAHSTMLRQKTTPPAFTPVQSRVLRRKCACDGPLGLIGESEECGKKRLSLQRRSKNQAEPPTAPSIVHEVLRSPGQPLDKETRDFFGPRFGHDFSNIRVHTDAKAAQSARAVNALAYTVGRDVVFGVGQYSPMTTEGQKLMAHELTHAMQQRMASGLPSSALSIGSPDSMFEQQADKLAIGVEQNDASVISGTSITIGGRRSTAIIQRQGALPSRQSSFDDEPAQLRHVIEASFAAGKFGCAKGNNAADCYNRLDAGARLVLRSLYNRLNKYGLWSHILYAWGIWTSGVGGVQFVVTDSGKFLSALVANPRFCLDTAAGGFLHKGATSVREISDSDSLHLSLASGNRVSVHIDAISPAMGREANFRCRYDPTAAAAHIGREVVPLGIPGLQIFPEPKPTYGLPERGERPPEFIRFEVRF